MEMVSMLMPEYVFFFIHDYFYDKRLKTWNEIIAII